MTQKDLAIQCLEKLDIYKPYIRRFKSKAGIPCFFENFAGFYANQEEELWNKIKEVEKEFGCIVYAITHEIIEFDECWSMLCISQNPDKLEDFLIKADGPRTYYVYSYVWNRSNPTLSEFGAITVKSAYGGIKRAH